MSKRPKSRQPAMLHRFFHLHAKLMFCVVVGVVAFFLLPQSWKLVARLLTGWDIAVALYLTIVYAFVAPCSIDRIKQRAAVEDESAVVILILTVLAAFASLFALILVLGGEKGSIHSATQLSFAMVTILLSWFFIHTIFALHYAHEYYGDRRDDRTGGLNFPGRERPDYWDFLYFSLIIAMTSQVSDVAITSKIIRRVATLHGVLSFFFNLGIIALTINMLAGAIS